MRPMRNLKLSPLSHFVLLILFLIGVFGLIMLPILLMGYPYAVSDTLKYGKILVESGRITDAREPMLPVILALFHPFLAWDNVNAWVGFSVAWFCLSMLPLWWSVRMLFDRSVAWFSVVVYALLPMSWLSAYSIGGYGFALLPLFLCFGIFLKLHSKRPLLTIILCGVCFGITLGIQHSYLAFMPWMALGYLWQERKNIVRCLVRILIFCTAAYFMFMAPYIPSALQPDMSPMQRIMVFYPLAAQAKPGEGHLYPDEFLYAHYKQEFDAEMEKNAPGRSFIVNQQDLNYRIIFGAGHFTIWDRIGSGTWLLINSIPDYFMMDYVGGTFLWLFIFPGIAIAWRTRKSLVLLIGGLILSMEFLLRLVLLFVSSHLNNFVWAFALFAGIGASAIVAIVANSWKLSPRKTTLVGILVAVLIGAQLLQATRKDLSRLYARSRTQEVYAATEALSKIPSDAVVAGPRRDDLFIFSPQHYVSVHPVTIDFLSKRGKLAEPFDLNGIEYIIGYTEEQVAAIKKVKPNIKVINLGDVPTVPPLNAFVRYLLNTVR